MAFSARISRSSSLAPRSFKPEGIPMSAANFLIAAMDYLRLLPGSIPLFFLPLPLRYRQNSRCRPACIHFHIGKENGVANSVRKVIKASELVGHGMYISKAGVIESNTCKIFRMGPHVLIFTSSHE
jgi:hypothetical protein